MIPSSSDIYNYSRFFSTIPSYNKETNIYWLKSEYKETQSNPFNMVAPIYAGIYNPLSNIKQPIGYVKLITSQSQYNEHLLNTDNYSFYWLNNNKIVASIHATYDYIGTGKNPFFEPNTTHTFNSSSSAYNLLNKSIKIKLFAETNTRQCTLQIL